MSDESLREHIDVSESGAPAGGRALRDMFSTDEIFHRITATADEEFSRSNRLLFLSGLAAGFSIGLSFLGSAALTAKVPGPAGWLLGAMLYPLGFIFIVVGRYQLFTENTLTPVTLVLTRIASLPTLFKVWGIVLLANILGVGVISYIFAKTGVFEPATIKVAQQMGMEALKPGWATLFWKGWFAGWIVAGMVWLNHAARDTVSRILITFILIYTVAVADLAHSIVGSSEVLYLVFHGGATFGAYLFHYFVPVVLGNTVGGILLVAILNYSQTRQKRFPDRDCGQLELTWWEWFFGRHTGMPDFVRSLNGLPSRVKNPAPATPEHVELVPAVSAEDHIMGTKEAPITMLQFGDYECPTSHRIHSIVKEIMREKEGKICFVYRHLPLSRQHPHAEHAAMAAEASADQGHFWEMSDELFEHQKHLEDSDLIRCARKLNLDVRQFEEDMQSERMRQRVLEDRRSGISSGVTGTNNLFINGQRYRKTMKYDTLLKEINHRLQEVEA